MLKIKILFVYYEPLLSDMKNTYVNKKDIIMFNVRT